MAGVVVRVMVVDDHPMWREGEARDLAGNGYLVTAAVGEGAQAVRVARAACLGSSADISGAV